jgi:hypothetical protein
MVQIGAWPKIPPQDGRLVKQRFVLPQHQTRWAGFLRAATASRANDSSGGADSRAGQSSYSSRDSHKDSGSTVLVDILQWVDHFEQWQT